MQKKRDDSDMKETKKIALTGMMGAGKSSVIAILQELNIAFLNCDAINAQLLRKGEIGYQRILASFEEVLVDANQELDRQAISDMIFSDPQKKKRLEQILHPLIQAEIMHACEQTSKPLIVVEVPLLFEVHWEAYFDEIWVVVCEREILLERLQQGRHIQREEALRRLAAQMSEEEKCHRADVILHNDGDRKALREQVIKALMNAIGELVC